eukprot:gb/GEZN01005105.1/.p1 GENE.gb/GEZN01005105.1/~~gb/GEZN01005105.1/.p1  ORF type:complete len:568 (+),score=66.68 gb/GEZN01005105.1/:67-1770(+)
MSSYVLLDGGDSISHSITSPLRGLVGLAATGLAGLAGWAGWAKTQRMYMSTGGDGVARAGASFHPRDGLEKVTVKPGPPVASLLAATHSTDGSSCVFTYLIYADQHLEHSPEFIKGGTAEEGWLYGVTGVTSSGALAKPTGIHSHVLKGRLLCWSPSLFAEKLESMDHFWGFSADGEGDVQRGTVSVVKQDGSSVKAVWYYHGGAGHHLQGALLGMGNPLLDISAEVPIEFFKKYGIKPADAILAEEKHLPLYKELEDKYKVSYIAGGATQNSIRVAQWMLHQFPGATAFIGSVGQDAYAKQIENCAKEDGVSTYFYKDSTEGTGTCACLILDHERSLVTQLKAANNYQTSHLDSPAIWQGVVEKAQYYYIAGFFLTVSPTAIMQVAKHSHEKKKTFCMNLSAPFICQFFKLPQLEALPFVDIIFGNEAEAEAFGQANELEDHSPIAVAKYLANMPKVNSDKPRIAIITQGPGPVIVAVGNKIEQFSVPKLEVHLIVDSNGAGDAFVGGFLSMYIQGKPIPECVRAGNYASRTILQVSGTELPKAGPSFHPLPLSVGSFNKGRMLAA